MFTMLTAYLKQNGSLLSSRLPFCFSTILKPTR
jgi:hypothetical protein